jgi:hypothetical protein
VDLEQSSSVGLPNAYFKSLGQSAEAGRFARPLDRCAVGRGHHFTARRHPKLIKLEPLKFWGALFRLVSWRDGAGDAPGCPRSMRRPQLRQPRVEVSAQIDLNLGA